MKFLIKSLFTFFLFTAVSYSQTYRDTLTREIIYNYAKDEVAYQKLKTDIKKLEEIEGKPNPEILHSNLTNFYKFKDLDYFKEVLTLLTRKYGYNLSYASGEELYYNDIINGSLKNWFKKMYIKNHGEWLSENLDKQIDIYRLNKLHADDQLAHGVILYLQDHPDLSEKQVKRLRQVDGMYFKRNLDILYNISSKIGVFPTGNSFALIQKSFWIAELHNLQHEDTFEETWKKMYPFYKASYLNKDISSIPFKNIDSNLYIHEGKQIFDLLKIENVPENVRRNADDTEIPVRDKEQTKKLRTELGWE